MENDKLDEQFKKVEEDIRRIEHSLRSDDEVLNGNISNTKLEEVAEHAEERFQETGRMAFKEIASHLRSMKTD